jgi:enterochelin esterase-like enzyme
MNRRWIYGILAIILAVTTGQTAAQSTGVSGQWRAEIDTPIGLLKYVYTLKADGSSLTGKIVVETQEGKLEMDVKEGKVSGDSISFVEPFKFQDNEIRIEYQGKLSGDEIKFERKVGDFGTENLTAHRIAAPKAEAPKPPAARRGPGGFGGPIVLGPDDKAVFPEVSSDLFVARTGIPHGTLAMVEYDSKTVGTRRKMQVYTPPGYSNQKKYPVLYLLHGIGGDETEWQRFASPNILFDNLLADKKVVPMIVVMPNGRAQANDRAEGDVYQGAPAFARFERDLLDDVIPAIESKYSVQADRDHRAVAGLSMGGGQSLNFGLGHLDTFAWVGAFSAAPNTKAPAQLMANPAEAARQLKLLYVSCGNKDGLIRISQGVHAYLKEQSVPHIWNVDGHAHDPETWRNNLYHFSLLVFAKN